MSKPKLTPWFPAHVKPVRPGVYQAKWGMCDVWPWSYWTGEKWANSSTTRKGALKNAKWTEGAKQDKSWRGRAEQPK